MRTRSDRQKQLYCILYAEMDRWQILRDIYNETHDMAVLSQIARVKKEMKRLVGEIEKHEELGNRERI